MAISRKRKYLIAVVAAAVFLFWRCLPDPLFEASTSSVLENEDGELLGARIADDGQWRFPQCDSVPYKFEIAVTLFEDEHFRKHPGVNPVSMLRALKQNFIEKKVVSGGSTISMQTIRLARKGKARTIKEKIIEVILALRLELSNSKSRILKLYASHAPFGGNVVGLDAAAWRYYGRAPYQLSWGESSTLAVLPNAPSLIYPGKNHEKLLAKRNRLLDKLHERGFMDAFTRDLAKEEPLPQKPKPLPNVCTHLLERLELENGSGSRQRTTINTTLQKNLTEMVDRHHQILVQNRIENAAVLVLDINNDKVLAYVGNTNCNSPDCGRDVDIIRSRRSTGSILKPLLYAAAIDEGLILPSTLIPDIPTDIAGFTPKNFDLSFDGAVHADNALIRSLNIPAVRLLRDFGLDRFHRKLQDLRIRHIDRSPAHYGLSLILGGAEASLWDICRSYKGMAKDLNEIRANNWRYGNSSYSPSHLLCEATNDTTTSPVSIYSAGASWKTFQVLTELNRPHQEGRWEHFSTSRRVAWKTGTSFGHRDAWAVGVTPEYVVGVWVGNADGEGRHGLTGLNSAAPILFDAFSRLPQTTWFEAPFEELEEITVCSKSGNRVGPHCEEFTAQLMPMKCMNGPTCEYHRKIHLDATGKKRVNSACYPIAEMHSANWFVLPPRMELYYRSKDPNYRSLPEWASACQQEESAIALIYPKGSDKLFVPRNIDGELSRVVFEFAHQQEDAVLHWHLNNSYLGTSTLKHKKGLLANAGKHTITVVDEFGNSFSKHFELIVKQ